MLGRCRRLQRRLLLPRLLLRINLRRRNRKMDPVERQGRPLMARRLLALPLYLRSRRTARILVLVPRARWRLLVRRLRRPLRS
jgi:hypothetical protein